MKKKEIYLSPEVVVFSIATNLNLLNSASIGGTIEDEWVDGGEFTDWGGDWTPVN